MSEAKVYPVPAEVADYALLTREQYESMYRRSLEDPDAFWAEQAEEFLTWFRKWDQVNNSDLTEGRIRWFEGGKLNVAYLGIVQIKDINRRHDLISSTAVPQQTSLWAREWHP